MSVVLPFLLRLVRVICLVIFEAKRVSPASNQKLNIVLKTLRKQQI
jgi:hypothetical protein